MTDFDEKKYVAVYDQFKVGQTIKLPQTWTWLMVFVSALFETPISRTKHDDYVDEDQISTKWWLWWTFEKQVGSAEDGYVLTVGGFDYAISTLGDSMKYHNGSKFSTK